MTGKASQRRDERTSNLVSRRAWMIASAASAGAMLVPGVSVAETPTVIDAVRAMSPALTGTQLPQTWAEPVAGLVGIILESSKSLRALDLGDVEPATAFSAG
jgi:hypothetical protein